MQRSKLTCARPIFPKHTEALGVARHSLHFLGKAIDFRIRKVSNPSLREAGLRLQEGGGQPVRPSIKRN